MRLCSVDGCERELTYVTKAMCRMHYERLRTTGSVNLIEHDPSIAATEHVRRCGFAQVLQAEIAGRPCEHLPRPA